MLKLIWKRLSTKGVQRYYILMCATQRRINIIFGALGYFKLVALPEGLQRLMSCKLALHVLVTFTEQVLPIYKNCFILNSFDVRNKNSYNKTNEKASGEVFWQHSLHIYWVSCAITRLASVKTWLWVKHRCFFRHLTAYSRRSTGIFVCNIADNFVVLYLSS